MSYRSFASCAGTAAVLCAFVLDRLRAGRRWPPSRETSLPTGACRSSDRRERHHRTRSPALRRRLLVVGIGWSRRTAGCSRSATHASAARPWDLVNGSSVWPQRVRVTVTGSRPTTDDALRVSATRRSSRASVRHGEAQRMSRRSLPGSIVGIAASRTTCWLLVGGRWGSRAQGRGRDRVVRVRLGNTSYEGRCETTVELSYGTIEKYPTASADWRAQTNKHLDWWNAPRGALVFYNTSGAGHVALSLGNGQVVSSSVNHHIDVAQVGFFQNPLGWAPEPW